MNKFNISRLNIGHENETEVTGVILKALDVTCDFYSANITLIPTIVNLTYGESPSTKVLSKLGVSGMNKSCMWLRDEVIRGGGAMDCSNLSEICKSWTSIKEYKVAKTTIHIYTNVP